MIRLSVADSAGRRLLEFPGDEVLVGRREGVDLFLNDAAASRDQCLLRVTGGGLRLLDLESANGTFVGGWRVFEALLREGEEIRVGNATVRIESFSGAPLAPPRGDASKLELLPLPSGGGGAPPAPDPRKLLPPSGAPPPAPQAPSAPPAESAPVETASHEFAREVRRLFRVFPWYGISLLAHALLLLLLAVVTRPVETQEVPVAISSGEFADAAPAPEIEAEPEIAPPEAEEAAPEPPLPIEEVAAAEAAEPEPQAERPQPIAPGRSNPLAVKLREPLSVGKTSKPGTPFPGTVEESNGAATRAVERGLGEGLGTLRGIPRDRILCVRGDYDQMENLLELYRIPHTTVRREDLSDRALRSAKVLFVNCARRPDSLAETRRVVELTRSFVERGGWLLTSDWALEPYVSLGFPGAIERLEPVRVQEDTTIAVAPADARHPLLEGVFPPRVESRWWLEQTSKFFVARDRERVQVLVRSEECRERYGAGDVVILFQPRRGGKVLHVLGHFWQKDGNQEGLVAMHRLIFNFVTECLAERAR